MVEHLWRDESLVLRRVFPSWSIVIPASFDETMVAEGQGYWHAWDDDRSISMTSMRLTDRGRPVTALEFLARAPEFLAGAPEFTGTPVDVLPLDTVGVAVTCPSTPPARASMLLSAVLAVDGCVLIVTITADDLEWARQTFLTIRSHTAERAAVH